MFVPIMCSSCGYVGMRRGAGGERIWDGVGGCG